MGHRIVTIYLRGAKIKVLLFLDVVDGEEGIQFHSMRGDYILSYFMPISDRDFARSLLKDFPIASIELKMEQIGKEAGAFS